MKFESIRKQTISKCDNGCTFNNFKHNTYDFGQKTIDHLFTSTKNYKPYEFKVIRKLQYKNINPQNTIVSDHYPILG